MQAFTSMLVLGAIASLAVACSSGASPEAPSLGPVTEGLAVPNLSSPSRAQGLGTVPLSQGGDAGVDATPPRPPPPPTGTQCNVVGEIYSAGCGVCGTSEAACEADHRVGDYGVCQGEVADGCQPGSTRPSSCGLCGTATEVCQLDCRWRSGKCVEPVDACEPGNVRYVTAGCGAADTFRKQWCGTSCQYAAPDSLACAPKDDFVSVSPLVGGKTITAGQLSSLTQQIPSIGSGSCPSRVLSSRTSFAWHQVKNTTQQTARVAVWFAAPRAGRDVDTIVAAYPGTSIPADADRASCQVVNDVCLGAECSPDPTAWSGLVGADALTIPSGESYVIYHAAYFSDDTAPYEMHVKTLSLE
ncbi:MAG: hypothetical protein HOO96_24730 [Polyangiaceae bacterium]|nr:hypothetical protein [Polyangiaceae bacterium]